MWNDWTRGFATGFGLAPVLLLVLGAMFIGRAIGTRFK